MSRSNSFLRSNKRALLNVAVVGLILYLVLPQLSGLQRSFSILGDAHVGDVLLTALAVAGTYCVAALTYCLLSIQPLRYGPTLLIQIASGLVNRLLPAGLGGLGINLAYLKKQGHSVPTATAIVATNNVLGLIGNALLVAVMLSIFRDKLPHLAGLNISRGVLVIVALALCISLVLILKQRALRQRLWSFFDDMRVYVRGALQRRMRISLALASSVLLTTLYATALFYAVSALGINFSWPQSLFIVSAGALAGALLPTPGGLGGVEAGLLTGLAAYSVPADLSVAAVLLYRGLTYWLPLLPGYIAFRLAQRAYL